MSTIKWIDDGYYVTEKRDLREIRRNLILTMLLNFAATAIKRLQGWLPGRSV
jgi:hypothetical protein